MKNVAELLKETKVAYYGNVKYRTSKWDVTLEDWIIKYSSKYKPTIEAIREANTTDEKLSKAMKSELLPCITVSAHFNELRQVNRRVSLNPVICIDIDKGDNPEITDWEKTKLLVMKHPSVFLTSLSCRGEGIYCIVYWNTELEFIDVWNSLENDFLEMGIVIDKNCKDITRLRFISYDSNTLIKKEVEEYNKTYTKPKADYTDTEFTATDAFTIKAIIYLITKCNYRANDYYTWLIDGFRLSTLGYEYGKLLFMLLSQHSDNYNEKYALQKYDECHSKTYMNKSSLTHYFSLLKNKLGSEWMNIVDKAKVE